MFYVVWFSLRWIFGITNILTKDSVEITQEMISILNKQTPLYNVKNWLFRRWVRFAKTKDGEMYVYIKYIHSEDKNN